MQGVNRVDSWAQFVNLVQDARVRNQALSAAGGPAKIARRTISQAAAAPYQAAVTAVAQQKPHEMAAVKMKVLGSYFDAYA
jgi:hypothetical protein